MSSLDIYRGIVVQNNITDANKARAATAVSHRPWICLVLDPTPCLPQSALCAKILVAAP
jgi:hypothetical protein